jgi:hypothetical protein
MSHESNAILAINSLDRYITSSTTSYIGLGVTWDVASPNTLTQIAPSSSVAPTVGNKLLSTPGLNGWPAINPTITNVAGVQPNTIITIDQPVTASSGGNRIVTQEVISQAQTNQPVSNGLLAKYQRSEPQCNNFTISSPGALIYGYIYKIIVSQIQLQYNIPTVIFGKNDTFYVNGVPVQIPYGFYSPNQLADVLQQRIRASTTVTDCLVTFDSEDGFIFSSVIRTISFSNPLSVPADIRDNVLKTYRLLGITKNNITSSNTQTSLDYPSFLYTPYIDIYSDVLTNYQNIKDTNTTVQKFKGLVARIYLSGTGNVQLTTPDAALGSAPFIMTADLNNCKVIQWTPDVAVPSIDFQLFDQYSELIPGAAEGFSTEFQMTLLCVEGQR